MPALQRSVSLRGAKFYRQGGKLMFVLHIDGSTRIGPREATNVDMDAHADAFEAFEAEDEGGAMGPLVSFRDPAIAAAPKESAPARRSKATTQTQT